MYPLTFALSLGLSQTGLTLKARLLDETGTPVGGFITSGFSERGRGLYLFSYASIPDDFQGAVEFTDDGAEVVVAIAEVNPPTEPEVDLDSMLQTPVAGHPSGTVGGALSRLGRGRINV